MQLLHKKICYSKNATLKASISKALAKVNDVLATPRQALILVKVRSHASRCEISYTLTERATAKHQRKGGEGEMS